MPIYYYTKLQNILNLSSLVWGGGIFLILILIIFTPPLQLWHRMGMFWIKLTNNIHLQSLRKVEKYNNILILTLVVKLNRRR